MGEQTAQRLDSLPGEFCRGWGCGGGTDHKVKGRKRQSIDPGCVQPGPLCPGSAAPTDTVCRPVRVAVGEDTASVVGDPSNGYPKGQSQA